MIERLQEAWGPGQVCHRREPACSGFRVRPRPGSLAERVCRRFDLEGLYAHQDRALSILESGRHLVLATATASGKSLVYMLHMAERVTLRPEARGLFIYPLKALAQDQLHGWQRIATAVDQPQAGAALYDGDLSAWRRRRLRELPPTVLMTNPEMLHLSLLAHHDKWASFWRNLELVVVDEVHTFRGVFGTHMAQVLRRLRRIGELYGAAPQFVFTSATVGNPRRLCRTLSGLRVAAVTRSDAPRGCRHMVLAEPPDGLVTGVIQLLRAALARGLRTIVYCQSRKLTELLAIWAARDAGPMAGRVGAYRAGLRPDERRDVEKRLAEGELSVLISTSALELGIDVGDLDLCILVGYPGSVMATLQRGGRVGRSGQESALMVVAGEDALDRYFLRHPQQLFDGRPESVVVNADNPRILGPHLVCAAAEAPLRPGDPMLRSPGARLALSDMVAQGQLWAGADAQGYFSRARAPHREVSLRGTGRRFRILDAEGRILGEIDAWRAFRETHPGAVYLHAGRTYRVEVLDVQEGRVGVLSQRTGGYTRVRTRKQTKILRAVQQRTGRGVCLWQGELCVTEQVTGYEERPLHRRGPARVFPLDLPPQDFVTEGIWFTVPPTLQAALEPGRHFMGSLHALEHALIGILPLRILADRGDLGGISTTCHEQLGEAAVFIYDGIPGGAGLSREAFAQFEAILAAATDQLDSCACRNGCPGCVHSPKCGSGNRPLDKAGALDLLRALAGRAEALGKGRAVRVRKAFPAPADGFTETLPALKPVRYGVLDIETRRSAEEVGGWHRASRMGLACAVLFDSRDDRFHVYLQADVDRLMAHLQGLELVVGFNLKRFDYRVLDGYRPGACTGLTTLDLLETVHQYLGFRLSLAHLARETLGAEKSADGLQSLQWWKAGEVERVVAYCRQDVAITRDLLRFGAIHGHLRFRNKAGQAVQIPVDWGPRLNGGPPDRR